MMAIDTKYVSINRSILLVRNQSFRQLIENTQILVIETMPVRVVWRVLCYAIIDDNQ